MSSANVPHDSFARLPGRLGLALFCLTAALVTSVLNSCDSLHESNEQAQIAQAFGAWKEDVINGRPDQAMAYFPRHIDDYLGQLNAGVIGSKTASNLTPTSASPGVDLLLRTALEKKVPDDLRAKLTLGALLKRITQKNLFNPRDIKQIDLGRIWITGDHATAEVYYQGTLTALRLPFIEEDQAWKIDVLALRPYAEILMRVDRAIKGETETQQVDQLVSKLPSL